VKFSDRADPEKNKKDLNIYGSAARFNVAPIIPLDIFLFVWTKQRTMTKSYGSAAIFNVRFGNPHSKFY
jgi:hypothetical protein